MIFLPNQKYATYQTIPIFELHLTEMPIMKHSFFFLCLLVLGLTRVHAQSVTKVCTPDERAQILVRPMAQALQLSEAQYTAVYNQFLQNEQRLEQAASLATDDPHTYAQKAQYAREASLNKIASSMLSKEQITYLTSYVNQQIQVAKNPKLRAKYDDILLFPYFALRPDKAPSVRQ